MFAMQGIFYDVVGDRVILRAMPVLLGVLCVLAIAYRYYSAFLAARVAVLNDSRVTPAHRLNDGQNYHPTNKWVLFGHHFAAISGAGPLIGPVLAIQYGYMPGLLWLVIGVCLAGAVQDMLVLAASVRRGGKSLAEIALTELGRPAAVTVSVAILLIVIIALAGLGFVVVKALGGEEAKLNEGMEIQLPTGKNPEVVARESTTEHQIVLFPQGDPAAEGQPADNSKIRYAPGQRQVERPEEFKIRVPAKSALPLAELKPGGTVTLPAGCVQLVRGSSWGTFTIACTIPIAFLVSLWMYKIRKGRVVEASVIGGVGVLAATVLGAWIPGSPLEPFFSLGKTETIIALCAYGFIASVLPVWLLLCPRDYISSFLKIGTIALLVIGVVFANPKLECKPLVETWSSGGPTFPWGGIFPFVFICIMCGAISGFHSLVSSGTTPKMVDKESHIRPIGYGAMLIEGLVGVIALIAAASLPYKMYNDINIDLERVGDYQPKLEQLDREYGFDPNAARDPIHKAGADSVTHLRVDNVDDMGQMVGESLRGRTGGAVTLAVGMARIFTQAMDSVGIAAQGIMKYWYHFAIMFEALFILTTIDTGTRIARFLLQESLGKIYKPFEKTDWLPGAVLATGLVTAGWGLLVYSGSIDTIWPMFGIANQLLAVIALCLVTTMLINSGRARYAPVTLIPMIFVTATTMTAGAQMLPQFMRLVESGRWSLPKGVLNISLTVFVICCVLTLLLIAAGRWFVVLRGAAPVYNSDEPVA